MDEDAIITDPVKWLKARWQYFRESMISARVLARLGYRYLKDYPKGLPPSEKASYMKSVKAEKPPLEWRKISDDLHVGTGRLTEFEESGNANDYWFLLESQKLPHHDPELLAQLPLEQSFIVYFGLLDGFLHALLREVTKKEPRLLARQKQVSWQEVLQADSLESLVDSMREEYLLEFGLKGIQDKVEWFKKNLKISPQLPEEVWKNLVLAEQARHLFTHTGGVVSRRYMEKTAKGELGTKLTITPEYVESLSHAIMLVAEQLCYLTLDKFWPGEVDPIELKVVLASGTAEPEA